MFSLRHVFVEWYPPNQSKWNFTGFPDTKIANHLLFHSDHLKRERDFLCTYFWVIRIGKPRNIFWRIFSCFPHAIFQVCHKRSRGFLLDILVQFHWVALKITSADSMLQVYQFYLNWHGRFWHSEIYLKCMA